MRMGRSSNWWFWPDFNDVEDAQDGAKMGVMACALIAGATTIFSGYGYFISITKDLDNFLGDMVVALIQIILGYGIYKMSRVASSMALVFFLADKLYSSIVYHKSWGIGFIIVWYLIQANRAVYWFRREPRLNPEKDNIPSKVKGGKPIVKGGKRCPVCGLINPINTLTCDCGNSLDPQRGYKEA